MHCDENIQVGGPSKIFGIIVNIKFCEIYCESDKKKKHFVYLRNTGRERVEYIHLLYQKL